MRVPEKFLNDINIKNKYFILNKLKYFSDTIVSSNCLNDIPKGYKSVVKY